MLPWALLKRGKHGDSKENYMCSVRNFSPLTLVPLMHLIISASLKVRAVPSSFWIEKMQNNRGGWRSWAAMRAIATTCVTLVDHAESCSAAPVTYLVHKANTVCCPFMVIFLSALLWRLVLIFLSLSQVQSGSDLPWGLQRMLTIYAAAEAQAISQTPFIHTWGPSAQAMIDTKPR